MSGRTFICVFLYSTTQAHEEICHPSRNGHNKRYGRFVFCLFPHVKRRFGRKKSRRNVK